jgi:hypothetical protein
LELDLFDIGGPNNQGQCNDEFFLVSGGSRVPPICGLNSGQHLVYSITPDSGPSQLSVVLSLATTKGTAAAALAGGGKSTGIWSIRVFQYECTSPVLAPVGCLQYFLSVTAVVQSFNYQDDVSIVPGGSGLTGVNHLANMEYSACVRMQAGYCGIRWSQYPGMIKNHKMRKKHLLLSQPIGSCRCCLSVRHILVNIVDSSIHDCCNVQ